MILHEFVDCFSNLTLASPGCGFPQSSALTLKIAAKANRDRRFAEPPYLTDGNMMLDR
jgi:hypothetical protein